MHVRERGKRKNNKNKNRTDAVYMPIEGESKKTHHHQQKSKKRKVIEREGEYECGATLTQWA